MFHTTDRGSTRWIGKVKGRLGVDIVQCQRANASAQTTGMSVVRGQRDRRELSAPRRELPAPRRSSPAPQRISTPLDSARIRDVKERPPVVSIKRHRLEPLSAPNGFFRPIVSWFLERPRNSCNFLGESLLRCNNRNAPRAFRFRSCPMGSPARRLCQARMTDPIFVS